MNFDHKKPTSQTDSQLLLVSGNPEQRVHPLELSPHIEEATFLTAYRVGIICAEFKKDA